MFINRYNLMYRILWIARNDPAPYRRELSPRIFEFRTNHLAHSLYTNSHRIRRAFKKAYELGIIKSADIQHGKIIVEFYF